MCVKKQEIKRNSPCGITGKRESLWAPYCFRKNPWSNNPCVSSPQHFRQYLPGPAWAGMSSAPSYLLFFSVKKKKSIFYLAFIYTGEHLIQTQGLILKRDLFIPRISTFVTGSEIEGYEAWLDWVICLVVWPKHFIDIFFIYLRLGMSRSPFFAPDPIPIIWFWQSADTDFSRSDLYAMH